VCPCSPGAYDNGWEEGGCAQQYLYFLSLGKQGERVKKTRERRQPGAQAGHHPPQHTRSGRCKACCVQHVRNAPRAGHTHEGDLLVQALSQPSCPWSFSTHVGSEHPCKIGHNRTVLLKSTPCAGPVSAITADRPNQSHRMRMV